MSDLIYLASPYSHPDFLVRNARFQAVCRASAKLLADGHLVYSPIAHTHPIALYGRIDGTWDTWSRLDRAMISRCQRMIVLLLDGWAESRGIREDVKIAKELGLPVSYLPREFAGVRIAITGGRDHSPSFVEMAAFWGLWYQIRGTVLLHGDARGVDRYVSRGVKATGCYPVIPFPVDTAIDGPWPLAGHHRNRRMLVDGHAEGLIANCVSTALVLGLKVWEWREEKGMFERIDRTDN